MRTIPELAEGTHRAKASGTLPNGKPVVVNSDGTVSVINSSDAAIGSATVFESGALGSPASATFDSNSNKVVIAYRDDGNTGKGTSVVGTVSGTSISFGSPVVFEDASTNSVTVDFDSTSNKVVIAYSDGGNSSYGTAIVGTVSGTSISFGTAAVFNSASTEYTATSYDSTAQKTVITYHDNGNSSQGTAIVGSVSGTSISFGSSTVFETGVTEETSSAFDSSSNRIVISYQDNSNSSRGTAVVGTVSGTSISFGSPVVFDSGSGVQYTATVFDSGSNKIVIAYRDGNNSGYGTAIVGTVSGTSINFGAKAVFNSANTNFIGAAFDGNAKKVVIVYRDAGDSNHGKYVGVSVSGSSMSFDDAITYNTANTFYNSATFDSNSNKVVIAYGDGGSSSAGTSRVINLEFTNLTSENYIGMSQGGSVADGSSATVDIIGSLSTNQSGLTAGQSYYVQTDGTIGETPADPSVFAGTAISATSLVVKT